MRGLTETASFNSLLMGFSVETEVSNIVSESDTSSFNSLLMGFSVETKQMPNRNGLRHKRFNSLLMGFSVETKPLLTSFLYPILLFQFPFNGIFR